MKENPFLSNEKLTDRVPGVKATLSTNIGIGYPPNNQSRSNNCSFLGLDSSQSSNILTKPYKDYSDNSPLLTSPLTSPLTAQIASPLSTPMTFPSSIDAQQLVQHLVSPLNPYGHIQKSHSIPNIQTTSYKELRQNVTQHQSKDTSFDTNVRSYTTYQPAKTMQRPQSPQLDIDLNLLTACLSNTNNVNEICKLIGMESQNAHVLTNSNGQRMPKQQIRYETTKQTHFQQPKQQVKFEAPRQKVRKQLASEHHHSKRQTSFKEDCMQNPKRTEKHRERSHENYQSEPISASYRTTIKNIQNSLDYIEDDEQFDFNQQDDDQTIRQQKPMKTVRLTQPPVEIRISRLEPEEFGTWASLKESMQKQLSKQTDKNGWRCFLTIGQQIRACRYQFR